MDEIMKELEVSESWSQELYWAFVQFFQKKISEKRPVLLL